MRHLAFIIIYYSLIFIFYFSSIFHSFLFFFIFIFIFFHLFLFPYLFLLFLGSGAGGAAGGSILIESPKGIFLGSGEIVFRGGYGGIDPLSNFQGGAGSGGKILIKTCIDNFLGSSDGRGGLTLLPFNYTVLYDKWYNFSNSELLHNYNINSQKSKQIIISAGAGLFGRRLSYFNNTLYNNVPTNNYYSNYFQMFLSDIRSHTYCINDNNLFRDQSISTIFESWNNHTLNLENSTFLSAITTSLGTPIGKLYLS